MRRANLTIFFVIAISLLFMTTAGCGHKHLKANWNPGALTFANGQECYWLDENKLVDMVPCDDPSLKNYKLIPKDNFRELLIEFQRLEDQ